MADLRGLRYLACLSTRLHFARAAEDLGITQSALSKAIQSLERDMGLRLFDRDQSGVTITEAGQRIVEKARSLLAAAQDFEHLVKLTSKRQEGRIRFGMTPVVMQALVPATIPLQLRKAPAFLHEVVAGESEALWQMLTAREIEFFVSQEWEVPQVLPTRIDPLGEFPVSLAVRTGHPLLSDRNSTSQFPVLVSAYGRKAGQLPLPLRYALPGAMHLFEDTTTLSRLTQASDAIWMTSAYAIVPEIEQNALAVLPWPDSEEPPAFRVAMYSMDRRELSPSARDLRQEFRAHIAQLSGRAGLY